MFSYVIKIVILVCVLKNTPCRAEWRTYFEVSRTILQLPRIMESVECVRKNIKDYQKDNEFF